MKFLIKLLAIAGAIVICQSLFSSIHFTSPVVILMLTIVLAFLNETIKPLIVALTLPFTIFSLGIFLLVINGAIILMADWLLDGFKVDSLFSAILFSLAISFFSTIIESVFNRMRAKQEE